MYVNKQKEWIWMSSEKFDVVIVGGGLAGLTAAVMLANEGKRVAVLEKGKNFGGRGSSKEVSGTFLNLGPHALYKKGKAIRILKELDIRVNGGTPNLNGKIYDQGSDFQLPSTFLSVLQTKYLNMKEKKEFLSLMLNIGKIDHALYFHQTLQQWVENHIQSPRIQSLFYALCRLSTYTNAPELVNAGAVLNQLRISLGGAIYVHRGWKTIIDQLLEKVSRLDVALLSNSTVIELDLKKKANTVSYQKGNEINQLTSEWIIATTPPKVVNRFLKGAQNTQLGQIISNATPVKTACLDVVLNYMTNPQHDFALDMNQSLYYSNHSQSAKLSYHPEHQVIHVMKYLRTDETLTSEEMLSSFLEKNQPQWKDHLVVQRFLPNLIVSHRIPTVGSIDMMDCAQREFEGLLLAGEWVSNEMLLAEAALITAKKAADQILTNKGNDEVE
jgi:phytoene dehydrogenase-like protein